MINAYRLAVAGVLGFSLCACSTMNSVTYVSRDTPKYFTGTRLNVAALRDDWVTLAEFERHGMKPAPYPLADLPFSVALDLFLTPYMLSCAIEVFGPDFSTCYAGGYTERAVPPGLPGGG